MDARLPSIPLAALLVALLAIPARGELANEELRCAPDAVELSPHRYLRSLSLDLRGSLPSGADYAALDEAMGAFESPPDLKALGPWFDAIIDQWLEGPEFRARVVRRHRALLWNSLTNVRLFNNNVNMSRQGGLYYRRNLGQRLYRGDRSPCLDEPARFDQDGRILTTEGADGVRREGWVEVNPYWDPTETVRVCAFDAQADLYSPSGTDCSTTAAYQDPECGCGPDLRWCQYANVTNAAIVDGMREAMDRRIAAVAEDGASYLTLFQGRQAWINGPLAFFYRHQRKITGGLTFDPAPLPDYLIPDLRFDEADTWVEVTLPASHAGVLTDPAFLLRFQTNRARANRFYDAFLCQPFTPPDAPLPVVEEGAALEPDLQQRAGCKYCHALLEPSAAFWGRWNEQGAGYLSPASYPQVREDCLSCAMEGGGCSRDCRLYYVTSALSEEETPYLGGLKSYLFRRETHEINVERGPELLATAAIADNRLPACAATRTAEWLLGREVEQGEAEWIQDLTADFVYEGLSYRALVKAVITSPVYRRVR